MFKMVVIQKHGLISYVHMHKHTCVIFVKNFETGGTMKGVRQQMRTYTKLTQKGSAKAILFQFGDM